MTTTRNAALAVVLCAGLFAAGAARAQDCTGVLSGDELQKAEDARYTAQVTNNFESMEKLFGDDLVYTHSSAVVDSKASYIETMRSGNVRYRVMRRTEVVVRTYDCLGILTGNGEFDVTVKGEDITVPLRFTSIWAKRGDDMQFIGWQATRIPPKK